MFKGDRGDKGDRGNDACCDNPCSTWTEWYPDPSTICEGEIFYQEKYNDCGEYDYREMTGTSEPFTWYPWEPDANTVCEGEEFYQYRYDNCYNYEDGFAIGTKQPIWSQWTPNTNTICIGREFQQTRTSDCGGTETQTSTGTAPIVWGEWYPNTNRVLTGVSFNQYRTNNCGDYESRPSIGTGSILCTASNTTNMGDVVVPISYQEYLNVCEKVDSGGLNVFLSSTGYEYSAYPSSTNSQKKWTRNIVGSFRNGGFYNFGSDRCGLRSSGVIIGTLTKESWNETITEPAVNGGAAAIDIIFKYVGNQMYMGIRVEFSTLTSDLRYLPGGEFYDPERTEFGPGTATVLGYNIPVTSLWCPNFSRECSSFAPPIYENTVINTLVVS
jgi:hypothetical protein